MSKLWDLTLGGEVEALSVEHPILGDQQVEVGFGVEGAVEELERGRSGDEGGGARLEGAEREGIGEVATQQAIDIVCAGEVGDDRAGGGAARSLGAKDGRRGAIGEDELVDELDMRDPFREDGRARRRLWRLF